MWVDRYYSPTEIIYDQGLDDFIEYPSEEEYGILANTSTSENQTSDAVLKWIHKVLDDLVWTYNT